MYWTRTETNGDTNRNEWARDSEIVSEKMLKELKTKKEKDKKNSMEKAILLERWS